MAESAVQSAIEELNYFLRQKDFFLVDVDERVRSLRNKLKGIHDLLNDVDEMRSEHEVVIKLWVDRIIEVAHYTEDVIDDFIFKSAKQRGETSAGLMSYPSTFARGIKDIPAIQDVGEKIIDIQRSLDEILSNGSQCGIDNRRASGEASTSSNQSQTLREKRPLIVEEADVVGMEDETRILLGRLMEGGTRRNVVSITGEGGIGKTTLAKKVYDNVQVMRFFDLRAWVSVSQNYLVRELLISIINCFERLSREQTERMQEEELRSKLSGNLEGKRYLVVVDDIWSIEAWDDLVTAFPDGENGSRVLLTTRNEDVAENVDAQSIPHRIRFLNENESWALFCKKALLGTACPPNLEDLARKMVAKCEGLPLSIAVLGGALSRKDKSVNEWKKLLENLGRWLDGRKYGISGILALSYHDLPCYLKPCFLYFGAFPEDSEISVRKLIRMWIAEGFVQRRRGEEMEDVAEDYLEELINGSMIQVAERKSNGVAKKCRIHDLVRDLVISKAHEERFLDVYGNIVPTSPTTARRLAITCGDISNCISLNSSTLHDLRSVLDFIQVSYMPENLTLKILGGDFKFLRVIRLRSRTLTSLPDEIGYLIHLRYLRLEMWELACLPSTITRLSNLQTLDIGRTHGCMLPDDIVKMEQIRDLMLCHHELSNGKQLHHLRNLKMLSMVEAGSWIKDGLEKLTNLRDLGISELRGKKGRDVQKALTCSISKLVHLRSLWLFAYVTIPVFQSFSKHEHLYKMRLDGRLAKLPEPHLFPPNLTELRLKSSKLDRDPMGILEKLPNLRTLIFEMDDSSFKDFAYTGKEMVCSVGGFPKLETLSICLNELEELRVVEGAMPNLSHLEFSFCDSLEMIPDGLRHITTLQELTLSGMTEKFLERVRKNEGEDWFKIRQIPSLVIEIDD